MPTYDVRVTKTMSFDAEAASPGEAAEKAEKWDIEGDGTDLDTVDWSVLSVREVE